MKTITLTDLEIATAVAALRVVAAEKHTQNGQRFALEKLAERLLAPPPSDVELAHIVAHARSQYFQRAWPFDDVIHFALRYSESIVLEEAKQDACKHADVRWSTHLQTYYCVDCKKVNP